MNRAITAAMLALSCGVSLADAPEGARGAAFEFAKKIVTPTLKNPASADFDWESVQYERTIRLLSPTGDEKIEVVMVRGVVRATNSFNAIVPSEWRVLMQHRDETYTPIAASVDGTDVLQTELSRHVLATIKKARAEKDEKDRAAARERNEAAGIKFPRLADEVLAEQKRLAEEQKKQADMRRVRDAGRTAGEQFAKRFKWDKVRVSDEQVERIRDKEIARLQYADEDAMQFSAGFMEGADAVRRK